MKPVQNNKWMEWKLKILIWIKMQIKYILYSCSIFSKCRKLIKCMETINRAYNLTDFNSLTGSNTFRINVCDARHIYVCTSTYIFGELHNRKLSKMGHVFFNLKTHSALWNAKLARYFYQFQSHVFQCKT